MRTDAMRTDFVTNISHELKTPVGAVAVLAEALIDESDPEIVHRLADHLVEESHRAVARSMICSNSRRSSRPGRATPPSTSPPSCVRPSPADAGRRRPRGADHRVGHARRTLDPR
jgi:hypothetical protein